MSDDGSAASAAKAFPRPVANEDFAFLYEGYNQQKLLIQRCRNGHIRFPPAIACPTCHALEWDSVEASGKGRLHSFTVHHHPPIAPWPVPHAVGLADMEEGFRLVAAMPGADVNALHIDMPIRVEFLQVGEGYYLPTLVVDTER